MYVHTWKLPQTTYPSIDFSVPWIALLLFDMLIFMMVATRAYHEIHHEVSFRKSMLLTLVLHHGTNPAFVYITQY